jgi:hypothetical protein
MNYSATDIHGTRFVIVPLCDWRVLHGPAVYLLCRREKGGSVTILYVGQTGELQGYMGPAHRKWEAAWGLGMDELHISPVISHAQRLNLETVIRHQFHPRLNEQGVSQMQQKSVSSALLSKPLQHYNALTRDAFSASRSTGVVNALLERQTNYLTSLVKR